MSDLDAQLLRLRRGLKDEDGLHWTDDQLSEAIGCALADINLAVGASYTLGGLDGAESTSLPADYHRLILGGAFGYAVNQEVIAQCNRFLFDRAGLDALLTLHKLTMEHFSVRLQSAARRLAEAAGAQRVQALQASASPGYPLPAETGLPGWKLPDDLES